MIHCRPLMNPMFPLFKGILLSQKEKNKYRMLTHILNLKKKKGSEEPRGRTGIKTQMYRMDLRTRGGAMVSWDEVREWHGLIYTTKCKIDS